MRMKCRLWDTEKKEFFKPTFDAPNGEVIEIYIRPCGDLVRRKLNSLEHESVFPGRYVQSWSTGHEDKNKNKIYEGDILRGASGYLYLMKYREDLGRFLLHDLEIGDDLEYENLENLDTMEVIGNIWENGDLLKEAV
jgi:hypothetical protein